MSAAELNWRQFPNESSGKLEYTERQKYVRTPYFYELKIQFLRQYYSNSESIFKNNLYTIDRLH